jgi:hypothetical protein
MPPIKLKTFRSLASRPDDVFLCLSSLWYRSEPANLLLWAASNKLTGPQNQRKPYTNSYTGIKLTTYFVLNNPTLLPYTEFDRFIYVCKLSGITSCLGKQHAVGINEQWNGWSWLTVSNKRREIAGTGCRNT